MITLNSNGILAEVSDSSRKNATSKQTRVRPELVTSDLDDDPLGPADKKADSRAKALLSSLAAISDLDMFLFGHQYDNYIGQYFLDKEGDKGFSDVRNGTGSYPAVFGFDWMDVLVHGRNFTKHVKFAYEQGGVITFDWLASNPVTGGDERDLRGRPCFDVVQGAESAARIQWNAWLDEIAHNMRLFSFGLTQEDTKGLIPIIFRFLHETTGKWYWWGIGMNGDRKETCSASEYIALWNYTQYYLTEYHGLHNILWNYAPSSPASKYSMAFGSRYPGNERVDIVAFDLYSSVDTYKDTMLEDCRAVNNFTEQNHKVAVIAETGISDGMQSVIRASNWYYEDFAATIMTDEQKLCQKISYAVAWENAHPDDYWVPLPQDPTWPGFYKLYQSPWTMFADDSLWNDISLNHGYRNEI